MKKWPLRMAAPVSSEALVLGLYDAFNARQLDRLDTLLDPEFVDHTPGEAQPPGVQGVKEIWAQIWARMPDVRVAVADLVTDGDRVAARVSFHHTASDGSPRTGGGFEFFWIRDGRVTDLWNLLRFS